MKKKKYEVLLNETYLWMLAHPDEKAVKVKIAADMEINRHKVANQIDELKKTLYIINDKVINKFNIQDCYLHINNKYLRAYYIICDLEENFELKDLATALGCSQKTLDNYGIRDKKQNIQKCVYGIKYRDEVIYIGYTSNFIERKEQHLTNIDCSINRAELYRYCDEQGIESKDVKIEIIYEGKEAKQVENALIKYFQPIGNVTSK